jgi:monoamine oxidase
MATSCARQCTGLLDCSFSQHHDGLVAQDRDVVVIGAGLAGLSAARTCLERGLSVRVMEARGRVGGRTWSRPFRGATVDLGAEWVSPHQHLAVMAELHRYGIDLAPAPAVESVTWSFEKRTTVAPNILTEDEQREVKDLFTQLESDAARIDFSDPRWHEPVADLDIPLASYLDVRDLSPITRGFFMLHAFVLMGADEKRYSALHLLHEFAGFGSCEEAFDGESQRVAGGTMSIASAIARDLEPAAISFDTTVMAVREHADEVEVHTDNQTLTARAVIVAVPVNVLRGMELDVPMVDAARRVIAEGHAGAITKVWVAADGLPAPYMSAGWPDVPESYGVLGDGLAVAAFQLVRETDSRGASATALATLRERHPDAVFADDYLAHDWVNDSLSRGTWHTAAAGQAGGWYALAAHPGPCFFAGGDLSRRWVGWMDGALTSGADAATRAAAQINGDPVPEVQG